MTDALLRLQVRDHYRARFPELESLVHHPVDYARVVAAIGNEVSITLLNSAHPNPPPVHLRLRRMWEPLGARARRLLFACITP